MRVKVISGFVNVGAPAEPGDVLDVTIPRAHDLITRGMAIEYIEPEIETPVTADPEPENADPGQPSRRRGRGR